MWVVAGFQAHSFYLAVMWRVKGDIYMYTYHLYLLLLGVYYLCIRMKSVIYFF